MRERIRGQTKFKNGPRRKVCETSTAGRKEITAKSEFQSQRLIRLLESASRELLGSSAIDG